MNKANARALKRILASKDVRASLKTFLAQQTRKAPVKPMKKARLAKQKQKRLTKKEETARIRGACAARAQGFCENHDCLGYPEEMDHWLGGNGRRRQQQSIATCWMLCSACHRDKTRGVPSAAEWNRRFAAHCLRHIYPFTPHIEHAPLLKSSTPSVPAADTPLPDKGIGGVDLKQEQLSEKEG